MEHYAGLDVSLELSSVCIVDERGTIISEVKVASEPEALIGFLRTQEVKIGRVGLELGFVAASSDVVRNQIGQPGDRNRRKDHTGRPHTPDRRGPRAWTRRS